MALPAVLVAVASPVTTGAAGAKPRRAPSITVLDPWACTSRMEAPIHEAKMGPGAMMAMSEVPEIALDGKSTTRLEPGGCCVGSRRTTRDRRVTDA